MSLGSRRADRSVPGRIPSLFPNLLMWLLVGMAGCASIDVRSDWDSSVDFSGYQRFHWVEPPRHENADPFADNDLLRKRVRLAVFRALEERGYRPTSSAEEADFLVTWDITLEERLRVSGGQLGGYYAGYRHPFRSGYPGYAGAGGSSTVRSDHLTAAPTTSAPSATINPTCHHRSRITPPQPPATARTPNRRASAGSCSARCP